MTYRDRRQAKAERYREWAEKREERAEATLKADEVYTRDHAFNTQPGHMPIRAKVIAREDRAYESLRKASEMQRKADSIEAAAAHAIYSDDKDAIERLEQKIAGLEAERSRIKAYNASCRKGDRNIDVLDEARKKEILSIARTSPEFMGKNGAFPSYVLSNLSGNIKRNRDRLATLEQQDS